MRLQKFLARAGVASRRGSEDLMTAGRVAVNGIVSTELGTKVDPATDIVTVDGSVVSITDGSVFIMLNKPAGYVSTMSDPQERNCVAMLVPREDYPGLFPVGRLDQDTTGLLLFTTDGEFAHRILHPKWKVNKYYLALVDGRLTEEDADMMRSGMVLDDGPCADAQVKILENRAAATAVSIIIREGRKRQVRRMCAAVGHRVHKLQRYAFGPLELGDLEIGSWRHLTADEVVKLRRSVGLDEFGGEIS